MRITTAEIPPDCKEEIEKIAQATGRTAGEVVREAIAQYLSETDPLRGQLVHATRVSNLYRRAVLCSALNNPMNFIHSKLECANQYVQDLLQLLHLYAIHYSSPVLEIQEYAEYIDFEFLLKDIPTIPISLIRAANAIDNLCQSKSEYCSLDKVQPEVDEIVKEAIYHYFGKTESLTNQLVQNEKLNLGVSMIDLCHKFNNPVAFMLGSLNYLHEDIQELFKLLHLYAKYYLPIVPEIQQYAEAIKLEFLVQELPNVINSLKIEANRISQLILPLYRFGTTTMPLHERLDCLVLILLPQQIAIENPTNIQVIKDMDRGQN
jgi:predicted translin family RNA/ssDNA-binding protein